MGKFFAVLIDIVSIQQYIFSSNKLKENIGASHIIGHLIFGEYLKKALGANLDIKKWENNPEEYVLESDKKAEFEIGYIGGGNALIIFNESNRATKFIRDYSLILLQYFPGLHPSFGIIDDFSYETDFIKQRKVLNDSLLKNKNLEFRNTSIFKHGIVNDCPLSGEVSEFENKQPDGKDIYISGDSKSKLDANELSNKYIEVVYKEELNDKFKFTDKLDELGQEKNKGYISVVHVDGNGIGAEFMKQKTLKDLRKLSKAVSVHAENSMQELVQYIVKLFIKDGLLYENEIYKLTKKNEKYILPFRPIITGGDDITFVCEGRLGVHLAEKFVEFFTGKEIGEKKIKIHACAGVAVVHTKYPFYKAYTLTSELTDQAKTKCRIEPSSWLSFYISSGGFSGALEDIMQQQYAVPLGMLYNGPYRLDGTSSSFNNLKNGIKEFTSGKNKWPKNKMMELRDVLRKEQEEMKYFKVSAKARQLKFPNSDIEQEVPLFVKEKDDKIDKTPYFDMIELADFYPTELLLKTK